MNREQEKDLRNWLESVGIIGSDGRPVKIEDMELPDDPDPDPEGEKDDMMASIPGRPDKEVSDVVRMVNLKLFSSFVPIGAQDQDRDGWQRSYQEAQLLATILGNAMIMYGLADTMIDVSDMKIG